MYAVYSCGVSVFVQMRVSVKFASRVPDPTRGATGADLEVTPSKPSTLSALAPLALKTLVPGGVSF